MPRAGYNAAEEGRFAAMIDSTNQERLIVCADGDAGAYLMVPLDQLEAVKALLRGNHISFWVDADAISVNGKPEIAVVNFGRGATAPELQRLLDASHQWSITRDPNGIGP